MPTINFGKVTKRKNSTLRPSVSSSYNCILKDNTSIEAPTFLLNIGSKPDYNYCIWDDNYYFVNQIVSVRQDLWEISCELDVLATYKSYILNTGAYVLYDNTPNIEIPDNRLPIQTSASTRRSSAACPFTLDSGCYIVALTGSNGTTGVYKLSETQLSDLIDDVTYIMDDIFSVYNNPPPQPTYTNDVADNIRIAANYFVDDLKWRLDCLRKPITQLFGSGNIPQNIRSCLYLPFNVGTTGSPTQIYLGTFQTQQSLGKLVTETVHRSATVQIPWPSNDFRKRSPYTELYLYMPYIGMVKLSSENLVNQTTLDVYYTLALRDGTLICTVKTGNGGDVIGQYSGNVGISVPVGISNVDMGKVAQTVLTGVGALATKNIGMIGMSALNFADSVTPNFTCLGGLDGLAGVGTDQNIRCYSIFHDTVAPPNQGLDIIGSPSMCFKNLGTLRGFVQCSDAHVSAPAQGNELDMIDNYLNTGFYIE